MKRSINHRSCNDAMEMCYLHRLALKNRRARLDVAQTVGRTMHNTDLLSVKKTNFQIKLLLKNVKMKRSLFYTGSAFLRQMTPRLIGSTHTGSSMIGFNLASTTTVNA